MSRLRLLWNWSLVQDTCSWAITYVIFAGKDYLYVTYDEKEPEGCLSHVGKLGGYQPIFLGEGCESFLHAAHEVGHALGLYHTQNRHDRDHYITPNWNKIKVCLQQC